MALSDVAPPVILLLGGLLYLGLIALSLFITYWVIRLAVRHGSLDARRRWRDQEDRVQRQLTAEGYNDDHGPR